MKIKNFSRLKLALLCVSTLSHDSFFHAYKLRLPHYNTIAFRCCYYNLYVIAISHFYSVEKKRIFNTHPTKNFNFRSCSSRLSERFLIMNVNYWIISKEYNLFQLHIKRNEEILFWSAAYDASDGWRSIVIAENTRGKWGC